MRDPWTSEDEHIGVTHTRPPRIDFRGTKRTQVKTLESSLTTEHFHLIGQGPISTNELYQGVPLALEGRSSLSNARALGPGAVKFDKRVESGATNHCFHLVLLLTRQAESCSNEDEENNSGDPTVPSTNPRFLYF